VSSEPRMSEPHADHFESLEVQADAAKLGMWIFLTSELLLFAGLFVLYAASRARDPQAFHEEVLHGAKLYGTINTAILLVSSTSAAAAVHRIRQGHRTGAIALFLATIALGAAFLAIKLVEYAKHLGAGIYPGGHGSYFLAHDAATHAPFWTLYYVMTGLHAVHVLVGMGLLTTVVLGIRDRTIVAGRSYRADLGAMYWHLIDLIWIFLWPLFYLA